MCNLWRVDGNRGPDQVFAGSIPELYDRYLVPLIFEVYAADLVARLKKVRPTSVLELAAGTGAVTRAMAAQLPGSVAITATDLNQPMLDYAAALGTERPVTWRQADAMALPFDDDSFEAVVCQFGVMFLPDRPTAFGEVYRVLRPGGVFVFNVWDRIEENEFALVVAEAVGTLFPDDPPMFLARTPYGYFDPERIRVDIGAGGFARPACFEILEARSRAASCSIPAIGFCQGTPLRLEIEARDPARLTEATSIAAAAISRRFGPSDIDGKIRGFIITTEKPDRRPAPDSWHH
jgi:SAM-dependent methyltransferase